MAQLMCQLPPAILCPVPQASAVDVLQVLTNKWTTLNCLVFGFWVRFWLCLPVHTLCLAIHLASNKGSCKMLLER